jgi:hypothetical protein
VCTRTLGTQTPGRFCSPTTSMPRRGDTNLGSRQAENLSSLSAVSTSRESAPSKRYSPSVCCCETNQSAVKRIIKKQACILQALCICNDEIYTRTSQMTYKPSISTILPRSSGIVPLSWFLKIILLIQTKSGAFSLYEMLTRVNQLCRTNCAVSTAIGREKQQKTGNNMNTCQTMQMIHKHLVTKLTRHTSPMSSCLALAGACQLFCCQRAHCKENIKMSTGAHKQPAST